MLLALLALLKAADYWVSRYELTTERRGFVQGATYAVVNAQLPGADAADPHRRCSSPALFLSTLKTESWRLPVVASGLWVVLALLGGVIYPAAVQALVVNPNQKEREEPYIRRNVLATRAGARHRRRRRGDGLVRLDLTTERAERRRRARCATSGSSTRARSSIGSAPTGPALRAHDPRPRHRPLRDRRRRAAGARWQPASSTSARSPTSRGRASTSSPRTAAGSCRRPSTASSRAAGPTTRRSSSTVRSCTSARTSPGYAVVAHRRRRGGLPGPDRTPGRIRATAASSSTRVLKRMSFALSFLDYNLIGSSAVDDESQLLWIRDVRDRVEQGRTVPRVRRRPVPRRPRRRRHVGDRRVHDERPLPVRRERRPRAAERATAGSTSRSTTSATA